MPRKTDPVKEVQAPTAPEVPAEVVPVHNLLTFRQNLIDIGLDFSERLKKSQGVNETDLKNLDSLRVLYDTLAQYGTN